jgi:hypothetical protein
VSRAIQEALELLGVTPGSDPASVVRAYRRLARETHPDISTAPDAAQRFSRITEAYHLVRDLTPIDAADAPDPADRTASPRGEDLLGPSPPGVSSHQPPDPPLLIDHIVASRGLQPWLWPTEFGSDHDPDHPPIIAGPVRVTPPSRASTTRRRQGGA